MKILESHSTATIKMETFRIATEEYGIVTYTKYFNQSGTLINETLQDDEGEDLANATLLIVVQKFVADEEEKQRRDEKNGVYPQYEDVAN